jgi:PKD repeat protein
VYTVSLVATNTVGSDSETKAGFVTVNGYAPVANFAGTPTSGSVPLTVTFTDQSTNTPTSWTWTFGDGGTSTAQNPVHQYQASGTYAVSLTATNAYGSDAETKTGYVTVTQTGQAPVANFAGSPTTGSVPLNVQFTDQSTNNPTSWIWNFGDRTTSTLQNPSHSYTKKGTYTVTLTVTNAYGGNTMTKSRYIVVT